jgi:SAM-dependent methyltransferase
MRKVVYMTGAALAVVTAGVLARERLGGRGPETQLPADDAYFTAYAPGGKYGYWANGPVGWLMAKLNPVFQGGMHETVAGMLDLRPEDELLDIGCGPGTFLATQARHVRRVVALDASPLMLREAEKRLAGRIAAGTARLVLGNAAALPFGDGEFSAVTAIFAPLKPAEAFRVLRPGGRLVFADPQPRRSPSDPTSAWGVRQHDEADYRQMAEEAGFTDLTFRYRGTPPLGGELLISGRKPAALPTAEATVSSGELMVEAETRTIPAESIPIG